MKNVNKLIKDGYVTSVKELLKFIVVDSGGAKQVLEDLCVDDVCHRELGEELCKCINDLKLITL